jgi:hypothetical protein
LRRNGNDVLEVGRIDAVSGKFLPLFDDRESESIDGWFHDAH